MYVWNLRICWIAAELHVAAQPDSLTAVELHPAGRLHGEEVRGAGQQAGGVAGTLVQQYQVRQPQTGRVG